MKKALLVLLFLVLAGCSTIDCGFARAIKASDDAILPEYAAYVQGDDTLTDEQKTTILRHLNTRRELVLEALAQCEGD